MPGPGWCSSHGETHSCQGSEEKEVSLLPSVRRVVLHCGSLFMVKHITYLSSPRTLKSLKEPQFPAPFDHSGASPAFPELSWDLRADLEAGLLSMHSHPCQDTSRLGSSPGEPHTDEGVRKVCLLPLDFGTHGSSFPTPSGKVFKNPLNLRHDEKEAST